MRAAFILLLIVLVLPTVDARIRRIRRGPGKLDMSLLANLTTEERTTKLKNSKWGK